MTSISPLPAANHTFPLPHLPKNDETNLSSVIAPKKCPPLFCQPDAAWRKLILSLSFRFSQKFSKSTTKQSSSISLSGNNTPAHLITPSSSTDQRTPPQSEKSLLSPEKSSALRSAQKKYLSTPSSTELNSLTVKQENSASALPLDAQPNSNGESVNDVRPCIPGPSKCHARPSTPSPNDAMVPTKSKTNVRLR